MACTVAQYLDLLSHELVRYDVATSAREAKSKYGRVNIYRMGHLLEALERVRKEVGSQTSDSVPDKLNLVYAIQTNFERDFPPVKRVLKQMERGTCKLSKAA